VNLYKAMGGGWVVDAEGLTTQAAQAAPSAPSAPGDASRPANAPAQDVK
jgi:multidrug efflux system outer membrane protein